MFQRPNFLALLFRSSNIEGDPQRLFFSANCAWNMVSAGTPREGQFAQTKLLMGLYPTFFFHELFYLFILLS
jgi:hypothetical protein